MTETDFNFVERIGLFESAEAIRIEELIDNFRWIYKLAMQLRTISQTLLKNLQKTVLKVRAPPQANMVPFECEGYAKSIDNLISKITAREDKFQKAVSKLDLVFQSNIVKQFGAVNGQISKLKSSYQKLLIKKQQYAEMKHEALNIELGRTGNNMDKALVQVKVKMEKLKLAMDSEVKTYQTGISKQHTALEKIDWSVMTLVAEATGIIGEYFTGVAEDLDELSSGLRETAATDKTATIMEEFAAYVKSLPTPQLETASLNATSKSTTCPATSATPAPASEPKVDEDKEPEVEEEEKESDVAQE